MGWTGCSPRGDSLQRLYRSTLRSSPWIPPHRAWPASARGRGKLIEHRERRTRRKPNAMPDTAWITAACTTLPALPHDQPGSIASASTWPSRYPCQLSENIRRPPAARDDGAAYPAKTPRAERQDRGCNAVPSAVLLFDEQHWSSLPKTIRPQPGRICENGLPQDYGKARSESLCSCAEQLVRSGSMIRNRHSFQCA